MWCAASFVVQVHRLDAVTGGLVLVAKTRVAAATLAGDLAAHNMQKRCAAACSMNAWLGEVGSDPDACLSCIRSFQGRQVVNWTTSNRRSITVPGMLPHSLTSCHQLLIEKSASQRLTAASQSRLHAQSQSDVLARG